MTRQPVESLLAAWAERCREVHGVVSIELRDADGVLAARNADHPHYAASTIKLAVLLEFLLRAEPSDEVEVVAEFASAADGSFTLTVDGDQDDWTWARLGQTVSLGRLAEQMIVHSGNLATDLLATRLGLEGVRQTLARHGLAEQLRVNRLIGDQAAEVVGISNSVTAHGVAELMAGLCWGAWLTRSAQADALALLARQAHTRMIPAGLPPGTWSASKGGWVPGVKNDVALIRPDAAPPYLLSICTTTDLGEAEGERLVAELSSITWEHWLRWHE